MTTSIQNSSDRRKLALVIGNGNYHRSDNKLNNSIKNAKELSDVLKTINFDVTIHTDIKDKKIMMDKIKDFVKKIENDDLILFYFAGHAYQFNGKNYLIPTQDKKIEKDTDVETYGIAAQQILNQLIEHEVVHSTIFILDCCRSYIFKKASKSGTVRNNGLHPMKAPNSTFIQYACAANETTNDDLFVKDLLRNIAKENISVPDLFQSISKDVEQESNGKQRPLSVNGLAKAKNVYLNQVMKCLSGIPSDTKWEVNAQTIAGNKGPGATLDRLHCPEGLWIDNNQTILVADSLNHRIMKYERSRGGQIMVGRNIYGYRLHPLTRPSNVIFNTKLNSLFICDYHNRRVLQWVRENGNYADVIIDNMQCYAAAIDDDGALYISDTERHEVRRYLPGEPGGKVVAGGNGRGRRLHQLNHPTYICIGDNQSLYISDSWNDRVVSWDKGAKKGVVVAGGKGKGKSLNQLDYPTGLFVDQLGTVYVADHWNHRIMRWRKDAQQGDRIAGDAYLGGDNSHQLNGPEGIAFDPDGNLYVADSNNHRIQRFRIQKT